MATAALLGLTAGPALAGTGGDPGSNNGLPDAGHCTTPLDTSWPEYQGDPSHAANGCSSTLNQSTVSQLKLNWYHGTNGPVSDTPAVNWGTVFAGDFGGMFYALNQATGATDWTFDTTGAHSCFLDTANPHTDGHGTSFGQIPGSPLTAVVNGTKTVYVIAGGSLYALDAANGKCLWAQDMDPATPGNSVELESSPVLDAAKNELLLGEDTNGSSGVALTGLLAFDAQTGHLVWKYVPERDTTIYPSEFDGNDAAALSCGDGTPNPYCTPANVPGLAANAKSNADACGDVWSSPALDASFEDPTGQNTFEGSVDPTTHLPSPNLQWQPKTITTTADNSDGLVVFGSADCAAHGTPRTALDHGDYIDNQTVFGLDPVTGVRVWNFVEPYDGKYMTGPDEPGSGDDDLGSSAILAKLPTSTLPPNTKCASIGGSKDQTTNLVIQGSKTGYAYGICEADGSKVWFRQIAQPGQLSPDFVGAVGGMIGSPAMGNSNALDGKTEKPTVFFTSAIATPITNDGIREPGDGDTNITSCPGLPSQLPLLPACPDLTLANDPQRFVSLHAVDAATGAVDYQVPSVPSFAAASYSNGVVYFPDSTAGGIVALNADSGLPLWGSSLASVPASAAAVVGNGIYLGTGETESNPDAPPQAFGIWSFTTSATVPSVTPPPTPAGALPVP